MRQLGWHQPYFCDADHINLRTVDRFLEPCDFFTIDVADQIGVAAAQAELDALYASAQRPDRQDGAAGNFGAVLSSRVRTWSGWGDIIWLRCWRRQKTYRYIEQAKGRGAFLTEVSMDETDAPQTPVELLLILAALADAGVPLADDCAEVYGPVQQGRGLRRRSSDSFARELEQDMAVIRYAVGAFGLPAELKLSLHSGSDKFSIYSAIHGAMTKMDAGLHLKTAGTTWLEEVIGLAESGGDALALVKEIYARGVCASRRAVRAVCRGDRYRCVATAGAGRGAALDRGAVDGRAAA